MVGHSCDSARTKYSRDLGDGRGLGGIWNDNLTDKPVEYAVAKREEFGGGPTDKPSSPSARRHEIRGQVNTDCAAALAGKPAHLLACPKTQVEYQCSRGVRIELEVLGDISGPLAHRYELSL